MIRYEIKKEKIRDTTLYIAYRTSDYFTEEPILKTITFSEDECRKKLSFLVGSEVEIYKSL